MSPDYMRPLVHSGTGMVMLAVAGVLMTVGGLWTRQVVKVRF
jgi:Flp pilus assembly protein TadB